MVGTKEEVARQAVRAAFSSWNFLPPPSSRSGGIRSEDRTFRQSGVRTELSTTVFSAEPEEWVRYLTLPHKDRYEPEVRVHLHTDAKLALTVFEPENEQSRWLSDLLDQGLRYLRRQLEPKPNALAAFNELACGDPRGQQRPSSLILLSEHVPADGTRETSHESAALGSEVRVVLQLRLVRFLREQLERGTWMPSDQRVGLYWPLISRVVSELAFPNASV